MGSPKAIGLASLGKDEGSSHGITELSQEKLFKEKPEPGTSGSHL
jgi:hypothetical protein